DQDRAAVRVGPDVAARLRERGSGGHTSSMARMVAESSLAPVGADGPPDSSLNRSLKLMAIGTAAGLFSGLFGGGGGSVIVPLLVLWLAYGERAATATSLAAIVFIAGFAAATQGLYGNVDLRDAALVGAPAVVCVVL